MKTNAGKPLCHFPARTRPLRQFVRIGARSAWQGALLGLCVVWVFQLEAWAGWDATRPWDTKSVGALKDLGASVALEKPAGGNPKLDSSLTELLEAYYRGGRAEAQSFGARHMLAIHDGRVQVEMEILPEAMDDVRKAIEVAGGEYQGHYKTLVQALVPINSLESLAQRSDVLFIRQPRRAIPLAISEGVGAANATTWHAAGYGGSGVKVAIIDSGFEGYTSLLGTELPASVTARDYTGEGIGGDVHGTACAEIVYDMAPGAQMYLSKISTTVQLSTAVNDLIEDGVHIISMSVGWALDGPGDGTGYLADIVKAARSDGIFYAVAAGNEARQTWSGQYVDHSGYHQWPDGSIYNCFSSDPAYCQTIPAGTLITVGLHWNDWSRVTQDYDLVLVQVASSALVPVATSLDSQNGQPGQEPEEAVIYTTPQDARYGVVVQKSSATSNVCFRLITDAEGYPLGISGKQRSLLFPADSPDAITVGAVDVNAPYPLESYSSQGPTFGSGGVCTGGSTKPDIAAYDNVSTESYGPEGFAGTSASTPHVAGAAALIKQRYPDFTVSQLQSYLESNAIDQGDQGKDNLYGSGRLNLQAPTPPCTGDCGYTSTITVADIITMVDIALQTASLSSCPAGDANGDQLITIDEILKAVNNALNGCG